MIFLARVRTTLVIFFFIIFEFTYQTDAFKIPGLQDLLDISEIFTQNAVTHPPEEGPLTAALCNLKTVYIQNRIKL